jgi:DNA-binding NtrC family response regulator
LSRIKNSKIDRDSASDPGWQSKHLAPAALNRLARHTWPGNVRELSNTLARAALWATGDRLTEHDIEEALLELPGAVSKGDGLLECPIEQGVDLLDQTRR